MTVMADASQASCPSSGEPTTRWDARVVLAVASLVLLAVPLGWRCRRWKTGGRRC